MSVFIDKYEEWVKDCTVVSCASGEFLNFIPDFISRVPCEYNIITPDKTSKAFSRGGYFNIGIRQAETKWVFLCDIDLLIPKLVWQIPLEDKVAYNLWVVYCPDNYNTDRYLASLYSPDSLKTQNYHGGCLLIEREILNQVHGFDERFAGWGGEDVDLFNRLRKMGVEFEWLPVLIKHRFHKEFKYPDDYLIYQNNNVGILQSNAEQGIIAVNPDGWGET